MHRSIALFSLLLALAVTEAPAQTVSNYAGRWRVVDVQSVVRRTGGIAMRTPRESLLRVFGKTELDLNSRFLTIDHSTGPRSPLPDTIRFGRIFRVQLSRAQSSPPPEQSAELQYEGPEEDIDLLEMEIPDMLRANGRTFYVMIGRGNNERLGFDDGATGDFRIVIGDGDRIGLYWGEGACFLILERVRRS